MALFVDPQRGAADGAVRRGDRRVAAFAEHRGTGEARGGADDVRARVRRLPELERDEPGRCARVVPRLPHVRQPDDGVVDDADRDEIVVRACSEELRARPALEEPGHEEFVVRFQQTTGPVMAKGVEDTAFYRYFRLAALNEVGGDPGRFGVAVDEFHRANAERAAVFRISCSRRTTHDTKRARDVRARIVALTWLAGEWASGWLLAGCARLLRRPPRGATRLSDARRRAGRSRASASMRISRRRCARRRSRPNWLSPDVEHEARVQDSPPAPRRSSR